MDALRSQQIFARDKKKMVRTHERSSHAHRYYYPHNWLSVEVTCQYDAFHLHVFKKVVISLGVMFNAWFDFVITLQPFGRTTEAGFCSQLHRRLRNKCIAHLSVQTVCCV